MKNSQGVTIIIINSHQRIEKGTGELGNKMTSVMYACKVGHDSRG